MLKTPIISLNPFYRLFRYQMVYITKKKHTYYLQMISIITFFFLPCSILWFKMFFSCRKRTTERVFPTCLCFTFWQGNGASSCYKDRPVCLVLFLSYYKKKIHFVNCFAIFHTTIHSHLLFTSVNSPTTSPKPITSSHT